MEDTQNTVLAEIVMAIKQEAEFSDPQHREVCKLFSDELIAGKPLNAYRFVLWDTANIWREYPRDDEEWIPRRKADLRHWKETLTVMLREEIRTWIVVELERLQGFTREQLVAAELQHNLPLFERALSDLDNPLTRDRHFLVLQLFERQCHELSWQLRKMGYGERCLSLEEENEASRLISEFEKLETWANVVGFEMNLWYLRSWRKHNPLNPQSFGRLF